MYSKELAIKSLKASRALHGVTQEQLADAIGVHRKTICSFESGKTAMKLDTAYDIAEFFNEPIDVVFGRN